VVADTENRKDGSHSISRRASVDFPAPEGEDRISKSPRREGSCAMIYSTF
jgi:hypothetical protein